MSALEAVRSAYLEQAVHAFRNRVTSNLDRLPEAIYAVGTDGNITYYNAACVPFAGRIPRLGVDRWCIMAGIYTLEGAHVPMEECAVAAVVRDGVAIRGQAIGQKADGSRVRLEGYPTPVYQNDNGTGELLGAVNMLVAVKTKRIVRPASCYPICIECAPQCKAALYALRPVASQIVGLEQEVRRASEQDRPALLARIDTLRTSLVALARRLRPHRAQALGLLE
ncbi:MAG TPA: hypothetical protein VF592_03515 [Sphingomonas sp.]